MMPKNLWQIFFWNYVLFIVVIYGKSRAKRKQSDNLTTSRYISGLDLLKARPLSSKRRQWEKIDTEGWKFMDGGKSGKLKHIPLRKVIRKKTTSLTVEFIGYSSSKKLATLFGIYLKNRKLPLFELSLDVLKWKVVLRYQGKKSFQRVTLMFGASLGNWSVLSAEMNKTHFTVTVGCLEVKSFKLYQKMNKIPRRAFGILGSDRYSENKFMGQLHEARFYPVAVARDRLMCSKPVQLQSDGYQNDESINGDRILLLEQQITQLNRMVEMLKAQGDHPVDCLQNANLTARVASLENCDTCILDCSLNGQYFEEGDTWNKDQCTVCICKNGRADCLRRTDIASCQTPCVTNPCMNYGSCTWYEETPDDFFCSCQSPYDGERCEYKENPCVWPAEPGICDQMIPRWYYDRFTQECLPFNYTGCGGNVNNYETLEQCRGAAITGACCYRQYSLKVEDVIVSAQKEEFGCKNISLMECQSTHRQVHGDMEIEVISFYPGVSCDDAGCGQAVSECKIDDRTYEVGEKAVLGCQECTCESSGQFVCSCSKKAVRKEIRDMTQAELLQFQAAIQQLRLVGPGNPWEEFRDIYMRHTMHSNGGPYFLPWHRMFLRQMEQRLQQIDCSITLPYFDFTTDVGSFEDAIIWQPNYFGGDGIDGCVLDHPFGLPGSWRPCIMRKFNTDIKLPTLIELAVALASDDYTEMSMCLESYVSYIHSYIGGDMATRSAPYDPIFYTIHAFIDMLYWQWQQKGNNKFVYPAAFGNIPMIPFNIPPSAILDLENDLCVTYVPPSKGHPCIRPSNGNGGVDPDRGDITPEGPSFTDGFDVLGYNKEGFDRRGYDRYGYKKDGYNRDGLNRQGFDREGYNRYGYNISGYSRYGYDNEGWSKENEQDLSRRYDAYGFDMNCLDRRGLTKNGFDKYGFNLQGSDIEDCDYFYDGPFSNIQSQRIWEILRVQEKTFLMTLPRTCEGLKPLPVNWLQQYWITEIKDVTGMVPVSRATLTQNHNSARFCFDIDPFVSPCGCDVGYVSCLENPCQTTSCPSWPEATCRIDFCGECKARWYLNGVEKDCYEERDFCQPNPCQNGGTCVASVWPTEPQLTTCLCLPEWDGHHCQYPAIDVCDLPLSRGRCAKRDTRWYFNPMTQGCERFVYSGCGGNGNNFETKTACESRCRVGACCYRYPKNSAATIGYDLQGYDAYGFSIVGLNRGREVRTEDNGIKTGRDRFRSRFDWQGFDENGYDRRGFDRQGLDKFGYDMEGFNLTGYNRAGEYDGIIDYDWRGYDAEGYNRAGFTCYGNNRNGLNSYGVYAEYTYRCRSLTIEQCQRIEATIKGNNIVRFSRGKKCEEVKCKESCGCSHGNMTYNFGQSFRIGCQYCKCSLTGAIECTCPQIYRRKEIRDMTQEELSKYQEAVRSLSDGYPSKWLNFAKMFADHKPQAVGNSASLPWHRYFLRMIEMEIQTMDCSITIPYYDWTVHAGNQEKSTIWAANIFGGNGMDITGCVQHHPFKNYYPPYWVPCLRRQFNSSIQLPDVIDIQYALNEPTFDRFRLSMELYFNLFKAWVGGHMASDFSPYDPLYLSVAAFIDRIWWDWQKKHDNGMLLYPQTLRYVPMAPFKATPDDVMDSKKQMCVTYFPLTEGALCNITIPNYNFNVMGYDRHGYDREGYDADGYNIYGVDRDGKPDERGIFNIYGYDRQGFKRNGYDISGFDRFGFYIDSYNVDGYDSVGFDRYGYDRYGFDRKGVTPFGFHRNGTLLVNAVPETFDAYGYNRYGLDRYGFDREGYDVFGFDSTGYDKLRCNRYFLGPMILIIKRWSEIELDKSDDKTIRIITRICPAVTALPEWRYLNNWLKRGDQLPLIEGILGKAQERALARAQQPRSSSVTEENVWLPLGPDRSLCFVSYYYTECPFGQFPVDCAEDLCTGRRCPGYPNAVCRVNRCGGCDYEWYNGVTGNILQCQGCIDREGIERGEGTTWPTSECETCTCQTGLVSCTEEICPVVTCEHAVKIPGECCLTCSAGCYYEGSLYSRGQRFANPADHCYTCTCEEGTVTCYDRVPCPDLGACKSVATFEGECCPYCLDCGGRANGTMWNETPCQKCTCLNGEVRCERVQCLPPDCGHPATPPGECCPVCDDCVIDGRQLRNGQTYMPDSCTECVCRDGHVYCEPTYCPMVRCRNPITPPGECCPRCDNDCTYNGRRYQHGSDFPSDEDKCMNCTCDNTFVECTPKICPRMNLPCRRPITLPGDCCPSQCPTCMSDGVEYANGDMWKSPTDPCETCLCEEGITTCHRMETCPVECDHGAVPQGECCSPCTDCVFEGQRVRDGQTFVRPGDNCQQCRCVSGMVTCQSLGPCPRLQCTVTETPPGACCPQCKRCDYQGQMYTHGDVVFQDDCTTCYCREGEVSCERVPCPDLRCNNPRDVPGQCCPVCEECYYKGVTYQEGQRFTPVREPCLDCICSRGEVNCGNRETECPRTTCSHPIRSPKQCCPICDGCSYLRKHFRNGQKFVPPGGDNCKVCRCMAGSVECSTMGCPPVQCHNAVLVPGQCCPACPMGCTVMGIEYRDGQTFIDFMDRCKVCTCMMGEIRCMAMMACEPVACTHPSRRPGNCCPSCTKCDWNNVQYRNGESFVNPRNPCEDCYCRDGSITCEAKQQPADCPAINCIEPVQDQATCCPVCDGTQSLTCQYAGHQYEAGQEVPASAGRCEVCRCLGGLIECSRRQCPPVSCRNPGNDGCCDTCNECSYGGQKYRLGETFTNPQESCEDCVCQGGTVECLRRLCDVPNCRDPVYPPGGCCPVCSDCTYQGLLYRDGERFDDPTNNCQTCQCREGTVQCQNSDCPQVPCAYPVLEGCCPACTNCNYYGTTYSNGETFINPRNPCEKCRCINGEVLCNTQGCSVVRCSHPYQGPCCQECNDCLYENRRYRNGQTFADVSNDCNRCECRDGTVTCESLPCPPVTCHNPTQGKCCPECRSCDYYGELVPNGRTVQSVLDPCEECFCQNGNMQCQEKGCPRENCTHPVQTLCCKECSDCSYKGRDYPNGLSFVDPTDDCQQCRCLYGNVECSQGPCHLDSGCHYGNSYYRDGDRFQDESDRCMMCSCIERVVQCNRKVCLPISCSHPVRGECCDECGDCFYRNHEYRNGQRFTDACQDCMCRDGSVRCTKKQCPPVTCADPVMVDCCPTCRDRNVGDGDCMVAGRRVWNGDLVADDRDSCKSCICQEGSLTCGIDQCPPVTCKHPAMGRCCPECRNCQIGARKMQHGASYPDLDDRCSLCVCQAGTITCEKRQCNDVRCTNPTLDDCGCPVCGSQCLYEGRTYENNKRFKHHTDPCQECTCRGGSVSCSSVLCPRLPCLSPVRQPGKCCPTCPESECVLLDEVYRHGEVFRHPRDDCQRCTCDDGRVSCEEDLGCRGREKSCIFEGREYGHREQFESDPCTSCFCDNGEVRCSEETCPALLCLQQETVPGQCCPVCSTAQDVANQCVYDDVTYQHGEEWFSDVCTSCRCYDGVVTCSGVTCLTPVCGPDDSLTVLPGSCCPVCLPNPGTCLVYGDPHYRTFDGDTLHFQGTCKYVMATDCDNQDFIIEVQHDDRGVKGVSWAQNFTIKVAGIMVELLQKDSVRVNDAPVTLPYTLGTDLSIERSGDSVLLNTKVGMKFLWNGDSQAELTVPGTYKRKMCGLCGNFNGYPQDDLRMKSGQITNSAAIFGNTWKASNQVRDGCEDALDIDPCVSAGYRARRAAATKCEVLRSPSFSRCHRAVPVDAFYSSCVYDLCACSNETACLCDILSSYAKECAKAGVRLEWRSATLCAFDCDESRGFLFDECGPVCTRTCNNWRTPLGELSENCYKPCVAGCQCPADKVVQNGRCISKTDCPKKNV